MLTIRMELIGKTPLLMHNIKLADPDYEFTKLIKAITDKRTKTEEDRREIERLEWLGGMVLGPNGMGPAVKVSAVRKCLINAGTISKQGKQVGRALIFSDLWVPLQYDGPRDLEKLRALPSFSDRSCVGISGKRTMRVRPQFSAWGTGVDAVLLEDVMDLGDLQRILDRAGKAEGLGDNRINGFGRFDGKVTVV